MIFSKVRPLFCQFLVIFILFWPCMIRYKTDYYQNYWCYIDHFSCLFRHRTIYHENNNISYVKNDSQMVIISRFGIWLALTWSKSLLSRLRTLLTFDLLDNNSWISIFRHCPILFRNRTIALEKSLPIVVKIQINKNETICKINKNMNLKTCIISVDYFERLRQVYHLLFLTLLITNLNFNSSVKNYKRLVCQTTHFSKAKVTSVRAVCYTLIDGILEKLSCSVITRVVLASNHFLNQMTFWPHLT